MGRPDSPPTGAPPLLPFLALVVAAESIGSAVWLLLADQRILAGFAALVGAVVMVGVTPSGLGRRGRFGERMLDRLFDACILAAVAWVWRHADPVASTAALVGLGASYLATYERARGQGLGYRGAEAVPYRAARQGLIALALLTGWIRWTLLVYVAVTLLAVGVRALNVASQERRRQLAAWEMQ